MTDFDRIQAVKKHAQARLRAIPGVHAVGIGPKIVAGRRTAEPAIIVFLVRKKALSEIPPDEIVPAEIEGIRTDVVEAAVPRRHTGTLPDRESYRSSGLDGGIQIQGGELIFGGTLGCIGATDEPNPRIVGITCHHVIAPATPLPSAASLTVSESPDHHTFTFGGISSAGLQVALDLVRVQAGVTSSSVLTYVTTAADSLATIANQLATHITTLAIPGVTATAPGPLGTQLMLAPGPGWFLFAAVSINRLFGIADEAQHTITFAGVVDPGLLVDVSVTLVGTEQAVHIYWVTTATDTLSSIAQKIADEMNDPLLGAVAFSGSATGAVLTVTRILDAEIETVSVAIYPARAQASADLKSAIAGNVITLSGTITGDYYGVFVNVNPGGLNPTYGTFVAPKKGMDLNDLASSLATALTNLHVPNVSFGAPGGAQITVLGAEEVECLITSNIRVGQPDNNFTSVCSDCLNSRIGTITAVRTDLDCALIQLDPGMKYKIEVEEIGVVLGTHDVTPEEVATQTYAVQKRGIVTGWTHGTVMAANVDGEILSETGVFHRYYTGALQIHSTSASPFATGGDSGAAVLSEPGKQVVGILFGGHGQDTVATPIGTIRDPLEVIVQTTTADKLGQVLTVPQPSGAHAMSALAPSATPSTIPVTRTSFGERLRAAEAKLAATPAGRRYAMLMRHFAPEMRFLLDTNRRVATIWQHSGGPQLVQAILAMAQGRDQALPAEIEGKPLADCIARIQNVLTRYGSPGLAMTWREHAPAIVALGGLNHQQLLAALRTR